MKYIYIGISIALLILAGWIAVTTPPCGGNYKFELGGESFFLFNCESNNQPIKQSSIAETKSQQEANNILQVLSVNHSKGTVGEYFNFDVTKVDKFLKSQTWKEQVINIKQLRTGLTGKVVIWRSMNGGSVGDGHGRWTSNVKPGQWETGDRIQLISK